MKFGLPSLNEQLSKTYNNSIHNKPVKLFVARQWSERSSNQETQLLNNPAVSGLVFSSFRFDNTEAIAHRDWIA